MNERRRVMGSKLPYDAEIEYLESSGTQWIDTGFRFSSDTKRRFKVAFLNYNRLKYSYGSNSGGNECLIRSTGTSYINGKTFSTTIPIGTVCDIIFDTSKGECYIDGILKASTSNVPNNKKEYLFGMISTENGNSIEDALEWKLFYHKTYVNEELVKDLIPVRVGNVGYMYDKVSKQLFGNNGTGAFILGPDK